jgi:hypothetical protein
MSKSKFYSFFTVDQIQTMTTTNINNQISRFEGIIQKMQSRGENPYKYQCELCYLIRELNYREKTKTSSKK